MTSSGEIALRLQDQGWRGLLPLLPHDAAPHIRLAADKAAEVERPRQGTGTVGEGRVVAAARLALYPDDAETVEAWVAVARRQRRAAGLPCRALGSVHRCRCPARRGGRRDLMEHAAPPA